MPEITEELKSALKNCNQELRDLYCEPAGFSSSKLRDLITNQVGKFSRLKQINQQKLEEWAEKDAVVGIDGSINRTGSSFPHYLTILQALGKSVNRQEAGVTCQKVFSPLIEEDWKAIENRAQSEKISFKEAADKLTTSLVAELEIKAAQTSIERCQPKLIMMDGSLIRYKTEAEAEWKQLVDLSLQNNVLLVGVIEEVGTCKVSEVLAEELPDNMQRMYDRELLFGLLEQGEMLTVNPEINFKSKLLQTAFLRTSQDPGVIGVDILADQRFQLEFMTNLVYSLTPDNSRGIPIWLDIVDEQVKITNQMVEALVDNYLDADIKQRLIHSKRQDRIY